ncbi:MAG: hypothetical protein RBT57_02905 [Paludibacter sp.]|jgi:hypothetical protein|nr:hypothetical protein [Paludibacter sp.]
MNWEYRRLEGRLIQVLYLRQETVELLQGLIKPSLPKLTKEFEKLKGMHEAGDITEKQLDRMVKLDQDIDDITAFLKQ